MYDLQLISHEEPGLVSIENFQELKEALAQILSRYEGMVYTEETLKTAKADKRDLTRLRREIDERRKEIKRAYLAPYQAFEAQVKELLGMIDAPLGEIKGFVTGVEEQEKREKWEQIERYFLQRSGELGGFAAQVLASPGFLEKKWLNKTTSARVWQAGVEEKIAAAARELAHIRATSGPFAGAVAAKYLETLSADGLTEYQDRLKAAQAGTIPATPAAVGGTVSRVVRLTGEPDALDRAFTLLAQLGVTCEVLEG